MDGRNVEGSSRTLLDKGTGNRLAIQQATGVRARSPSIDMVAVDAHFGYYADVVTGLVLLSPYLGPGDFIARIRASGGLKVWAPSADDGFYDRLWSWLKGYHDGRDRPELILSFGERDRLNPAHELVAEIIPPDKIIRRDGGHGWGVW